MQKYFIQLDICTLCDLNCVSCGMRHLNYGSLGPGYLKFDNFKKFIDDNKEMISKIEISNSGEPFINPDSPKILKYAFENGITLTCRNGTNFNNVSEETIKAIVDYQLEDIFIAIDGASQEVYEKYRRNGNYNKVIENVKKLVEYKKLKNSSLPNIYWQYIIRESTDDPLEIESAIKQANEIGDIKIKFKLTWENDYIPKNEEEVKKLTGLTSLTRSEYNTNGNDESYLQENKCYLLWSRIAIN